MSTVCFDQAMAVEAKSWKGEARTALAYDGRRAEFFRHYVRQAAREGILRICFMHIGESQVAMQIAVEQQQGFWLLKIGYDAGFATASPGPVADARNHSPCRRRRTEDL